MSDDDIQGMYSLILYSGTLNIGLSTDCAQALGYSVRSFSTGYRFSDSQMLRYNFLVML